MEFWLAFLAGATTMWTTFVVLGLTLHAIEKIRERREPRPRRVLEARGLELIDMEMSEI